MYGGGGNYLKASDLRTYLLAFSGFLCRTFYCFSVDLLQFLFRIFHSFSVDLKYTGFALCIGIFRVFHVVFRGPFIGLRAVRCFLPLSLLCHLAQLHRGRGIVLAATGQADTLYANSAQTQHRSANIYANMCDCRTNSARPADISADIYDYIRQPHE